jgi:hypothetical protein
MYSPDYYKTSYRALSLRGVARMRGILSLPLVYLITRFKKPTPTAWMPQTWADLECGERELSERFFHATSLHRGAFKRLGFTELGFKKLKRVLNPNHRDGGGINYLDSSRCHYGQVIYNRLHVPPPVSTDREHVVIAFTAAFREGVLSYTNKAKTPFDSVPRHTVVRLQSDDTAALYQRFVEHLKQLNEPPRCFPDLPSLQAWFDSDAMEVFEYRVRQRLFIRMSDDEAAAALRKLPPPLPGR